MKIKSSKNFLILAVVSFFLFSLTTDPAARVKIAWNQSQFPQAGLPLIDKVPVIDGNFQQQEWSQALAFTGLYSRWAYILPAAMQGWVYLGYDEKNLYIGLRSLFPPGGEKGLKARTTQHDAAEKIEGEDHWTLVFLLPKANYRFHINALGAYSDQCIRPEDRGKPYHQVGLEWESRAVVKAGKSENTWDIEMAIPFSSFSLEKAPEDGTTWRALFIRERTWPGLGSAAYGEWNGAVEYMPSDAGLLIFSGKVPAFQLLETGDLRGMKAEPVFQFTNPWSEKKSVSLQLTIESGSQILFAEKKEIELVAGESKLVKISPQEIKLQEGWSGRFCVEASSEKDHLYSQMLQFYPVTPKEYRRLAHWPYGTWPYDSPLKEIWELGCAHYPYFQSMDVWVNTDYSFLPEVTRKAYSCQVKLEKTGEGKIIRQETIILEKGKGRCHWENLFLQEGNYQVTGQLLNKEGIPIGQVLKQEFVRKVYPWEHNRLGITEKVYAPFRPIKVDRSKKILSPWGREYHLGTLGLVSRITTTEETEIPAFNICGPIRLEVTRDGEVKTVSGSTEIVSVAEGRVQLQGKGQWENLKFTVESFLRYDGWYQVNLTVDPWKTQQVEKLELVIPLGSYPDTLYGYRTNWFYGALPAGALIWSNLSEKKENLFTPAIGIGNGDVSLWWYADSDGEWLLDYSLPSQLITRDPDGINLRLRFVNTAVEVKKPLAVSFALLAAPVKPDLPDRRKREWGEIFWKLQDTGGYGYWGNGVDSITPGYQESDYQRLKEAIEKWKKAFLPQQAPSDVCLILYNSGHMLGQAMEEFESFSGEWCGQTPVEPTPEYKDSDVHAQVPWHRADILRQDWRSQPKKLGPTVADLVQSNVDCRLWYYQKNCEKLGINGYWFDNQPIWPGTNVSTGRAYVTSEGKIRPNYCVFARDQLFWRLFNLTRELGYESCNLISLAPVFSTAGWVWNIEMDAYIYRHGGDLFETLEQRRHYDIVSRVIDVDPTPLDPVARFRAISRMRRLPGQTCSNLDQQASSIHGSRSVLALNLLHDFGVDGNRIHRQEFDKVIKALRRFGFFQPEVKFLPYWRNSHYVSFSEKNVLISLYHHSGSGNVMAVLVNPEKHPVTGQMLLNFSALKIEKGKFQDAETEQWLGEIREEKVAGLKITVPAREFRLVLFQKE